MNEKYLTAGVTILVAIVGLAALAVLVSKASDTTGVITAGSGGFADVLCTALSPLGIKCGKGRGLIENVTSSITF